MTTVQFPNGFNAGSIRALYIEMYSNEKLISHGTCFLAFKRVDRNGYKALIFTAKHNLTGKDSFTDQFLDEEEKNIPNKVKIYFHKKESNGFFFEEIDLYSEPTKFLDPTWVDYSKDRPWIDVSAIPVKDNLLNRINIGAYVDVSNQWNHSDLAPTKALQIIGFPLKRKDLYYSIWMTGSLAYEPRFDFPLVIKGNTEMLPAYLINAKTFKGQSGSLVTKYLDANPSANNGYFTHASGACDDVLGIYTCRLRADDEPQSDLGLVWKCSLLDEMLSASEVIVKTYQTS